MNAVLCNLLTTEFTCFFCCFVLENLALLYAPAAESEEDIVQQTRFDEFIKTIRCGATSVKAKPGVKSESRTPEIIQGEFSICLAQVNTSISSR